MISGKIKFSGQDANKLEYNPEKIKKSFYQICQFKNDKTKLYGTRKVIFDENYNIIAKYEKDYNFKTLKRFMKNNAKHNKFRIYPVNDISFIGYPNKSDLMIVNSNLMAKDNNMFDDKFVMDAFTDMTFSGMINYNTLAGPGKNVSQHQKKIGGTSSNFYNGAPDGNNLIMINNNIVNYK